MAAYTHDEQLLRVEDLGIDFGGLRALNGFNLTIFDKEIIGLIGPNGAGKTTVFNLLTNVYKPTRGKVVVADHSLSGQKTYEVTKSGIARTFQNIRLFRDMTVLDNVKVGLNYYRNYGVPAALLRMKSFWTGERDIDAKAHELLEVFNMEDSANQLAKSLPYGAQRKLEIARALATNPRVLLLDEPAAGMNDTETKELMDTIRQIRDQFDVAILLIEHDMNLVMGICERIIVLDYGEVIAMGNPEEIRNNQRVVEAYLGKPDA